MERFLTLLVVLWSSSAYLSINIAVEAAPVYDVTSYGAVGDGQTDDSQGFLKAWEATCEDKGDEGTPVMYVPDGRMFLLSPTCFKGPCNSNNVQVQVLGYIVAPDSMSGWKNCTSDSWLTFSHVAGLTVEGSGTINGQGSIWWNGGKLPESCHWPTALYFQKCDNLVLTGLHHMDSPRAHIAINGCNQVSLSSLTITAPESSPNTDGIDIASSSNLNLENLVIQTGDDCVAINGNSYFINISGVFCGPGHGISVGSLGGGSSTDVVEEVHVRNCTFTNTMCGARIKTWQNGSGHARSISFEDITLNAAGNPIIIDQQYDPRLGPIHPDGVGVVVSDVRYNGFRGTSSTNKAIELICGDKVGCSGIIMDNVNITSSSPGKKVVSSCKNASGRATKTSPLVPCLGG